MRGKYHIIVQNNKLRYEFFRAICEEKGRVSWDK